MVVSWSPGTLSDYQRAGVPVFQPMGCAVPIVQREVKPGRPATSTVLRGTRRDRQGWLPFRHHANAKLLACSDAGLVPGRSSEIPLPRLIIAPPGIADVAACTSVKDAYCALLNSIMFLHRVKIQRSCACRSAKLVKTNSSGAAVAARVSFGRCTVDEPHILVEDIPTRARIGHYATSDNIIPAHLPSRHCAIVILKGNVGMTVAVIIASGLYVPCGSWIVPIRPPAIIRDRSFPIARQSHCRSAKEYRCGHHHRNHQCP